MAINRFIVFAAAWSFFSLHNTSNADETTPIRIDNINFTVASGLALDRVTVPELIQWPIAAAYHPNGDLLVLECHWNRESVQKQLESKPHKIVQLSDTNGDGDFDKRLVVADGLGFPEGIMVLGNDLLVSAPPQILRLSDKDGDGFYETRDVWFDAGTLTHCANDLHGPLLGPDGWVYWTKGAFAEQKHPLIDRTNPDKETSAPSKAAHIYRRHPNGGPIERLMTGGMDNPCDLTFSPEGERFFCSTFMHHPGNGLRDGIGHAPRGGMFGKQHQVLDGHWTTGPLLQPIANLGPAAPASVHYLQSRSIAESVSLKPSSSPAGYPNGFLVTSQFNLHKIGLHRLVPSGSSFETENVDLLSADRVDFHPVDVLEEPNGSLLVFDTGGWYDLCCPSSGSDQKIAMGGIYRLRTVDVENEAIKDVKNGSPQPTVEQAMQIACDRTQDTRSRKESLWQLARAITASPSNSNAMARIIECSVDSDPSVQQTATSIVGLNRWKHAMPGLLAVLESREPAPVRSALESLGVVGDSSCLKPILVAMARFPEDRLIRHSGIYALMEIGDVDSLVSIAMQTDNESDLHATVYALNQLGKIPDGLLPRLVQRLAGSSQALRDLSIECLARSPQGVSLCVPFLESAWEKEDAQQLAAGVRIVQVGRTNSVLQARVAHWMQVGSSVSPKRQDFLLTCLQQLSGDRIPAEWSKSLSAWIQVASNETMIQIANAIRKAKFSEEDRVAIVGELRARAEASLISAPDVAIAALASSPIHPIPLSLACSSLVVEQLVAPENKLASTADAALSKSQLDVEAARELVARLEHVPSLYLQSAIDALLRCASADIDRGLLEKLPSVPAIKTLAVEKVVASVNGRSEEVKKQWLAMMQSTIRPPENIAKELDAWLTRLPAGDAKRGYQVFSNAKAACSSCHQIGYVGGKLGPELSSIGRTRTRRDLVEAIVYPSLRMAQGYNPIRIRTVDDEVFNGLLTKQTDTHIELICGADKTSRIEKSEIEEQSESKQSVMPSGLDQQISLEDFADLLAFLESKR